MLKSKINFNPQEEHNKTLQLKASSQGDIPITDKCTADRMIRETVHSTSKIKTERKDLR